MTDTTLDSQPAVKPNLWNPLALILWSFIFTPLFGIYFQAKNWKTLNQTNEFKTSLMWGGIYVVYIIFNLLVMAASDSNNPSLLVNISTGIAWILLILWFILNAIKQGKYIKQNNIEYNKKSIFIPIGIGVVGMAIHMGLLMWAMTPSIEENAAELVTKISKQNYGSGTKCVKVEIDKKVTDELYKATAYLDNGNEMKISIITKGDDMRITILNQ